VDLEEGSKERRLGEKKKEKGSSYMRARSSTSRKTKKGEGPGRENMRKYIFGISLLRV